MNGPLSAATGARSQALVAWLALVGGALGCAVGDGKGEVHGALDVNGCTFNPTVGIHFPDSTGGLYQLKPDFFVGQPIDADPITAPGFPANQMVIRIQYSPARLESADALLFAVQDSAAVARCLRGGVDPIDPMLCDRSAPSLGLDGEGRVFIGMDFETVRSFFVLNASCPYAYLSTDALGSCVNDTCPDIQLCPGRDSWISFSHYGAPDPDLTKPIPPDFRVNDGERIRASGFHVELCDAATVQRVLDHELPVPVPNILATLEGTFDFNLVRGQAGQPFP